MPILAANGGYQFGSANRTHPELGDYNQRARVPDILNGLATQCIRGLPPGVRKTMVVDGTYQRKLLEKHNHLLKRENKSASTHNQARIPLYAESINMLDGLADDEFNQYQDEHPKIVPLFEVDVAEAVTPYVTYIEKEFDEPDQETTRELRQAQESLEMVVSQRVKASQLEEVDLGTGEEPKPINRDVFAWSYEDMQGLDPQLYQHQIHLSMDAKPVAQPRYRMNPTMRLKSRRKSTNC